MDERLEPLLEFVVPKANLIVAKTWPHVDFHNFCDHLIRKTCETTLSNSPSQNLNSLTIGILYNLERIIPQLSESIQFALMTQTDLKLTAYNKEFNFRIRDLPSVTF